ncbi:hypothetical protein [Streptomyces sp. NPDC090022]|uniref:hypothetical protein n=1 Tax=Streptomyces sp. NPDC090022 TaxID=3365920 RepID=UPI003826EB32
MSGTPSWTRKARAALAEAMAVVCAVLLCVFGTGPAAAGAPAEPCPASAPADPGGEGQADPAADPEVRASVRALTRGVPVRRPPEAGVPVSLATPPGGISYGSPLPERSLRTVRSVVLRC